MDGAGLAVVLPRLHCRKVRLWWEKQFTLSKYLGSTMDLFTWNDMNEPSVFNGPEVSMPKDTKNLEGVEHREWHNIWAVHADGHSVGLQNRQTVPVPLRGSLPPLPGAKVRSRGSSR